MEGSASDGSSGPSVLLLLPAFEAKADSNMILDLCRAIEGRESRRLASPAGETFSFLGAGLFSFSFSRSSMDLEDVLAMVAGMGAETGAGAIGCLGGNGRC